MVSVSVDGRRSGGSKDAKTPQMVDVPLSSELGSFLIDLSDPAIADRMVVRNELQFQYLARIAKVLTARGATNNLGSMREEAMLIRVLANHIGEVHKNPTKWSKWALSLLHDLNQSQTESSSQAASGRAFFNNNIKTQLEKIIMICILGQPASPDFSTEGVFKTPRPGSQIVMDLIETNLTIQLGPGVPPIVNVHWLPEALVFQLPELFIPALLLNHLNTPIPKVLLELPLSSQNQHAVLKSSVSLLGLKLIKAHGKRAKDLFDRFLMKSVQTYFETCSHYLQSSPRVLPSDWHRNIFSRILQLLIANCISFQEFFSLLSNCECERLFPIIAMEYRDRLSIIQFQDSSGEMKYLGELWPQLLSFLVSTSGLISPFIDLLWLLNKWLTTFFEKGFDGDPALQPVPEVLTSAMGHLAIMLKETVTAGFVKEFLNTDLQGQDWIERLGLNQQCLYRENSRGVCSNPVRALCDSFLGLLHSDREAEVGHLLYEARCESLCTALEQLLVNIAAKEELKPHIAHLISGLKTSRLYLNRLVNFYFNSLGGNEDDFIEFLEAADSSQLPLLLSSLVLLTRLGTIILSSRSKIFQAILKLAKTNYKSKAIVLSLVELCQAYLQNNSLAPATTTPLIYYQMTEFGFNALFFAFEKRCRSPTDLGPFIGTIKSLMWQLSGVQDPVVFIKQLFSFAVPSTPRLSELPVPKVARAQMPRLIDENQAHTFYCDFAKPTFEFFPNRRPEIEAIPPLQPLNILEALPSKELSDAVNHNIVDLMDLCQSFYHTEPESSFLIAEAIGLAVDVYDAPPSDFSSLITYAGSVDRPRRHRFIFDRFKDNPILLEMLNILSSEPAAFNKTKAIWGSLFVSLMHFWKLKRTNKPCEYPKELFMIKRLIHILGLAKWLPPPIHYVSELFDLISSREIGNILSVSLWPCIVHWGSEMPVTSRIVGDTVPMLAPSASLPGFQTIHVIGFYLKPILVVLRAHAIEAAHLFPLFYTTHKGPVICQADWERKLAP